MSSKIKILTDDRLDDRLPHTEFPRCILLEQSSSIILTDPQSGSLMTNEMSRIVDRFQGQGKWIPSLQRHGQSASWNEGGVIFEQIGVTTFDVKKPVSMSDVTIWIIDGLK